VAEVLEAEVGGLALETMRLLDLLLSLGGVVGLVERWEGGGIRYSLILRDLGLVLGLQGLLVMMRGVAKKTGRTTLCRLRIRSRRFRLRLRRGGQGLRGDLVSNRDFRRGLVQLKMGWGSFKWALVVAIELVGVVLERSPWRTAVW